MYAYTADELRGCMSDAMTCEQDSGGALNVTQLKQKFVFTDTTHTHTHNTLKSPHFRKPTHAITGQERLKVLHMHSEEERATDRECRSQCKHVVATAQGCTCWQ